MRKIGTILILSLLCLCFFSACGSSEVTISYIAETGGAVYGELSQTVEHGESCTQVYAVAETGYRFTGWSDGQKSSQRLDTKVTESKTFTAQFEKIEYVTIQYVAEVGGVVYGELSQTLEHGESCTQVYAVAEAGYRFTGWSDGQKSSQRLDTKVTESKTLTAQFEKIEHVTIQYIAEVGGVVYGELSQTVEYGKNCTQVYAVAEAGYRFTGWSDGQKSSQRLDINVSESTTLTAQFEKIEYVMIQYIAETGGMIYGESSQTVEHGKNCTQVYAVVASGGGYRFTGWSDGQKSSQRLDTNVTENKTLTAQFEKVEYVTIQYIAETGGAVYGELCQTVERGENCTQVYAVAEAGYRFTGWSDGQKSSQRLDIDVTESKMVTACFENINVLFYSNEILVRKYVLNDFANVDTAKIVGYASRKHFEGWRFTGVYEGFNNSNPLILIKSFFVDEKDIPDITLDAVYSESDPETDIPLQSKTIAHALGGINGKNYLNSKEAFETNYQKGFRFFEADVALTTDSVIVLSHDRGQYTYEQFMANKSDDHTPLSLENLFDYMTEFSNIYVDLDTLGFGKDEEVEIFVNALKNLLSNYSAELLNRIIVEITPWNETLIDPLRDEIGITNFLYTEAWYTNDLTEFESICERCSEMGIRYVSLNHNSSCAFTVEKAELLHRYGLYVMLYTFNDPVMLYQLYDIGADCIFTDYVYI